MAHPGLVDVHFWTGTVGIVFYIVSMWIAGVTQGLMWKEFTADGLLAYPNFVETVTKLKPMYWGRAIGGLLFLSGMFMLAWNVARTVMLARKPVDEEATVPDAAPAHVPAHHWHAVLEGKPLVLAGLTAVVIAIGGIVEMVPVFLIEANVPTIAAVKPYTPLELEGRDIYVREGCYNCHSQMVRPFRDEVIRYGDYSKPGEFVYDHPFQWGSKRTGPDLHRVGGKYNNLWHLRHMDDPRLTSPGSLMPAYRFMLETPLDLRLTSTKVKAMRKLGVPYTDAEQKDAEALARAQAQAIGDDLAREGADGMHDKEITALIAYLQRLGRDIREKAPEGAKPGPVAQQAQGAKP